MERSRVSGNETVVLECYEPSNYAEIIVGSISLMRLASRGIEDLVPSDYTKFHFHKCLGRINIIKTPLGLSVVIEKSSDARKME